MSDDQLQSLLTFFKAVGEANRLKILGLLANREYGVGELADHLNLREPTVSHHLARLREAGLVTVTADGNARIYALDVEALADLNRDIFSPANLATLVAEPQSTDEKTLSRYVSDAEITQIPTRRARRKLVLNWLVEKFDHDRFYPEAELNDIIKRHNPDSASLRRYMIEERLMARDKGIYWRL